MINNLSSKLFLIILFKSITISYCFSQISGCSDAINFHIQWVKQIPSGKEEGKNGKESEKWIDFIVGEKKQINIIKPVAILPYEENLLFILDQGTQNIISYNRTKEEASLLINSVDEIYPSLVGICKDQKDNLFFTDSKYNQIYKYNLENEKVQEFNLALKLSQPTGIAYSVINGQIWVIQTKMHKISILDSSGIIIKEIGGRGAGTAKFNYPTSIWIDNNGLAYIVDALNYRLQIFDQHGEFISMFGEQGNASGFFARPKGVATDSFGNIYIVDALFHTVQIFNKSGKFLYQFGSQGRDKGKFWLPTGIYIDKEDFIYIADSYNSRIQVFKLARNE